MRTEQEIRKMIKKARQHPERFYGGFNPPDVIKVLEWVLEEEEQ